MRSGMVSVTVRLSMEDAVEIRRLLGSGGAGDGGLDEGLRELAGGALSVTTRLPLEGAVRMFLRMRAAEEEGSGPKSGGGRP